MSEFQFGKIDIAGIHARTALKMIAMECHPFSVHLQIMACAELVRSIAKQQKIELPLDWTTRIRPERKAEWRAATVKAYNFFKHADKDPSATLPASDVARIEELNDLELATNITNLGALGHKFPPVYNGHWAMIFAIYPDIINWNTLSEDKPEFVKAYHQIQNSDRRTHTHALRKILIEEGELPFS